MQRSDLSNKQTLSTGEASKIMNITKSAVHAAIKNKRLNATFKTTRWVIHKDDLIEYEKNRYNRSKSLFQGRPLYCPEKGEYSVNQTAELLNTSPQRIYYLIRNGGLKSDRRGSAWIITKAEIDKIYEMEKNRKRRKRNRGSLKKAMGE